jgi:tRNA-uridine 2-sulfurtransferase
MSADRVVVGISGGVDSAVAAALLAREGREVHALFMRNWDDDDGYCTAAADLQDARRVCEDLGIPLHVVNFAAEYRARVFGHFLDELAAGRTPNPDVLCNREIKFGVCLEHARRLGATRFATGHYARLDSAQGGPRLRRAADRSKDQSYFLHTVSAEAFDLCEFPVGNLSKTEVRRLAREFALPVHDKRDSTGICFIGERPFGEFLSQYLPAMPGPIETPEGTRLGTHRGLMYYTLGQRQGLALGGVRGGAEAPWYVAAKHLDSNRLVVVQGAAHPMLLADEILTEPAQWVAGSPPAADFRCTVKLRYRQDDQSCATSAFEDGRCRVHLMTPQRAVTPGQSAVFYDGEVCLGGAVIASTSQRGTAAVVRSA